MNRTKIISLAIEVSKAESKWKGLYCALLTIHCLFYLSLCALCVLCGEIRYGKKDQEDPGLP